MAFFDVYGPFDIVREGRACARPQAGFWKQLEYEDDLDSANGCYMFCLKNGESYVPWYVGMTVSQRGFRGEVFQGHKLDIYDEIMDERRGAPVLLLFPLLTPNEEKFSKANGERPTVEWLEKTLMAMAFRRNPEIWNIRDMGNVRNVTVRGVIGEKAPGRRHSDVEVARKALGL